MVYLVYEWFNGLYPVKTVEEFSSIEQLERYKLDHVSCKDNIIAVIEGTRLGQYEHRAKGMKKERVWL